MKQPFTPEGFKQIYSRVPRLTVGVVIQTKDGVVLSKRNLPSWHGQWHIPGGTVYYNEFVDDAVRRVAQEELGVDVSIERFLGYLHYPSEEKERGFGWTIELNFYCSIKSGMLRGGEQAETIDVFKTLPKNTIQEAKKFLSEHLSISIGDSIK